MAASSTESSSETFSQTLQDSKLGNDDRGGTTSGADSEAAAEEAESEQRWLKLKAEALCLFHSPQVQDVNDALSAVLLLCQGSPSEDRPTSAQSDSTASQGNLRNFLSSLRRLRLLSRQGALARKQRSSPRLGPVSRPAFLQSKKTLPPQWKTKTAPLPTETLPLPARIRR